MTAKEILEERFRDSELVRVYFNNLFALYLCKEFISKHDKRKVKEKSNDSKKRNSKHTS